MEKDCIFFDLDGTLTDPKPGITKSARYALESFGIRVEDLDVLTTFIGPPLLESFIKLYGFSEENAKKAAGKFREYFQDHGIFDNSVYPGVENMLEGLKQSGKTLVLATSKAEVFAKRILDYFDLAKYFSFVSGCELDFRRADKAEVIAYALENMKLSADNCVMVGDREHDALGAARNNMECIGVLYGYGSRQELEAAGAAYIAHDVNELANMLHN